MARQLSLVGDEDDPRDRLVACEACGTLNEEATELVASLQEEAESLRKELSQKIRKIHRLQREADLQLTNSPQYKDALKVLKKWQEVCHPSAVELGGERLKKVIGRLNGGYTVEMLEECIVGYKAFPYVIEGRRCAHGSPAQRFIDAELIFRDPKRVDQGIALSHEVEHRQARIPALPADEPEKEIELGALGQAAVNLARFGFYVFPIAPRRKVPVTQNGLKDATREEWRIAKFWLEHPDYNIAVRCGAESGLVVLDVDDVKGGLESLNQLEKDFGELPATVRVVTPRGGSHYYFRHPGVDIYNTESFPGPGLDIRGDGGYVLVPPSEGPNGRCYVLDEEVAIADMPEWLLNGLTNRQRKASGKVDPSQWEKLISERIPEGARNGQMLRLAGHLWSKGHSPGQVLEIVRGLNESRCKPPLPDDEIHHIVNSVARMRSR